jgi:hypothetical protein
MTARGVGDGETVEDRDIRWNDNSFEAYYKRELSADIIR